MTNTNMQRNLGRYRLAEFFQGQADANRDTRTLLRVYGSGISPHLLDSITRYQLIDEESAIGRA